MLKRNAIISRYTLERILATESQKYATVLRRLTSKALLFCLLTVCFAGQSQSQPETLRTVRAYWHDPKAIAEVVQHMEPEHLNREAGYLILELDEARIPWLQSLGFDVDIDWQVTAFRQSIYQSQQPLIGGNGIPGFSCYLTVEETFSLIDDWQSAFPELVETVDIGDSWMKAQGLGGYDLRVLKLSRQNQIENKPQVLLITGLHSRELAPVGLATAFAQWLLENDGSDAIATYLLDEVDFHFLLQANPDGRVRAEGGSSWRKNTNDTTCNTSGLEGADLNRNFAFGWGCCGGSSAFGCSSTYRGTSATSEPETLAIATYVEQIFADLRDDDPADRAPSDLNGMFFDIHSYGEWVLWPFGFDATEAANGVALQTLGRKFAFHNGYSPEKASQSFVTDGTTDDFAYGTVGVPAFTFELGTEFFQTCATFEADVLPVNMAALRDAALVARAPYLWPAGPAIADVQVQTQANQITLSAVAADDRFNNSNGVEPVQQVEEVVFFLGLPPWRGGQAQPCMPVDGAFNSASEPFQVTIPFADLTPGRHWLYVQAKDTLGNWGQVMPSFFEVPPKPSARMVGQVVEALTHQPVAVDLLASQATTRSDASGAFDLTVLPGEQQLSTSGVPYLEESRPSLSLATGQVQPVNLTVVPRCTRYFEDGESGAADWSLGDWQLGEITAETGSYAFDDSPGSPAQANALAVLTSPVIDTSSLREPVLTFYHQHDLAADDVARVAVNYDGEGWQQVASFALSRPNFGQVKLALAEAQTLQIRFTLETGSTPASGWQVDRISVAGASYQCLREDHFLQLLGQWSQGDLDLRDLCKVVGHTWAR